MSRDLFSLQSYHYELPKELIAQTPEKQRDHSRVLIVDRQTGSFSQCQFSNLVDILQQGDSFVFNDTKVLPARLLGRRSTGGKVEIFLLKERTVGTWEALIQPAKKIKTGEKIAIGEDFECRIATILSDGNRIVEFSWEGDFEKQLEKYGHIPLPQYIHRSDDAEDRTRYQTVFAVKPGAVAAPTAGLHFSTEMLARCYEKGIFHSSITLHVGLGTFRPVQVEDIRDHSMHSEPFIISDEAAAIFNSRTPTSRQICVGTTCCRALESACSLEGNVIPGDYETSIFIYPGYHFKYVRSLLTNFHLPKSSLLMLVAAFGGYELIMEAYAYAIKERFRFYSYGDAMLIL